MSDLLPLGADIRLGKSTTREFDQKLLVFLDAVVGEHPKLIIYVNSRTERDLLVEYLGEKEARVLDGRGTFASREEHVHQFETDPDVKYLIISHGFATGWRLRSMETRVAILFWDQPPSAAIRMQMVARGENIRALN